VAARKASIRSSGGMQPLYPTDERMTIAWRTGERLQVEMLAVNDTNGL